MRRATPDDAEALHALMRAAFTPFRDQYTDACFDATIIDAPRFRRRMQEGPVWVLDSEGQAVGTVGAKVDDRGLYAAGQSWINKEHVIGRAKGYLPYVRSPARPAPRLSLATAYGTVCTSFSHPLARASCSTLVAMACR